MLRAEFDRVAQDNEKDYNDRRQSRARVDTLLPVKDFSFVLKAQCENNFQAKNFRAR